LPVSIYDASISWTDPDERWRIAIDGKNITNKHYVLAGLQLASPVRPSVTGYINDPRVVLLRATVNFK
jgi:iron complex outermembrane receptor protein